MSEDFTLPTHEHGLSSSDEAEIAAEDPPARALPLQAVLLEFSRNAVRSHGPRAFEVLRQVKTPPSFPPSFPPLLDFSRYPVTNALVSPLPFCQPSNRRSV